MRSGTTKSSNWMAALVATRVHPKFGRLYLDPRAAGNLPRSPAAVARRMVGLAGALILNNMTFENAAFAATSLLRQYAQSRGKAGRPVLLDCA
jgi:hypothetical protein